MMTPEVRIVLTMWSITVALTCAWLGAHYGWEKITTNSNFQYDVKSVVSWIDDWLRYPAYLCGTISLIYTIIWVFRILWIGEVF